MNNSIIEGLQVTVIGVSTVFFVLIILMVVLYLMKFVFYKKPKAKKEFVLDSVETAPKVNEESEDVKELIAILTAAIAASLNQSTYNLKIKSFRRLENRAPVWNKVSRSEQIANKL